MDDILVNISSSIEEVIINVSSSNENVNVIISEFRGRSAYQVWLDAGNVGTENDFFIYLSQVGTSASFEDVYERKGRGILSGSVLNYIPVIVSGSSQIDVLNTQNFTTISSSIDLRLDTLEGFSSSLGDGFVTDTELQLTASVIENKINVTASLFNTFSSSISTTIKTKLDTDGVISGSSQVQLSGINGTTFANTNFTFPQDLVVQGKITAQEFYTELISSSIIYESGSTKFGDSLDDTHIFTGSILVNGRINVSGGITGSLRGTADTASYVAWVNIDNKPIYVSQSVYTTDSASFDSRLNNIQLFTQSIDSRVDNIELTTQSLNSSVVNINNFTSSADNRLDNIELFTSSINTTIKTKLNVENVISGSSQLTASYDGRYELQGRQILSGSVLNYIPVIVSQSSQIELNNISGSTFANTNFTFPQDLVVQGKLTAQEFFTEYITSSVILESGSTKFGDSLDDTHKFTGSVFMTGSLEVNGQMNVARSIIIEPTHILYTNFIEQNGTNLGISYYAEGSGHRFTGSVSITGSLTLNGQPIESGRLDETEFYLFTSSYNIYTESVNSQLTNLEFESGSIRNDFNNYTSSTDGRLLSIENETGSVRLELNLYTQSTDIRLDNIELFTSSIDTTIKTKLNFEGVISGSSQLTSSYDQRYILSGSITETTWDNIANKPSGIVSSSSQLTSSFDLRYAFSGSGGTLPSGVISGSNQLTASYDGRYELQGRSILSGSVLNYIPVIVSGSSQINFTQLNGISANIISSSTDTQNVDVIITGGSISANLKGGVVSGSSQIDVTQTQNYSTLATTGSNTFNGNQIINGDLEVSIDTIILTGSMYVSGTIEVIGDITGSLSGTATTASYVEYQNVANKPTLVSGSSQLTSSLDIRYELQGTTILSGSVLNYIPIIVSQSSQINIYDTTNYGNFSSSLDNTNLSQSLRITDIELFTQSIDGRVDNLEITTASINLRLDSLEIESGSIRATLNQFTASYNTGSFSGSFTGSFLGDVIGTSSVAIFAISASYIDGGFY